MHHKKVRKLHSVIGNLCTAKLTFNLSHIIKVKWRELCGCGFLVIGSSSFLLRDFTQEAFKCRTEILLLPFYSEPTVLKKLRLEFPIHLRQAVHGFLLQEKLWARNGFPTFVNSNIYILESNFASKREKLSFLKFILP